MAFALGIISWKVHKKLHVNFFMVYLLIIRFLALTKLFLSKHKGLEKTIVIGYDPSHANMSEVVAPLKIFCTLIRCLNNERVP